MKSDKLFVLLIAGLLWSDAAFAYVDPVNGAIMLQLLLSGAAGVIVVFRRAVGDLFRRLTGRVRDRTESSE